MIDLQQISKLQRLAKLTATLSFVIFVSLFLVGAWQLRHLYQTISTAQDQLKKIASQRQEMENKIKELDLQIADKTQRNAALNETLQKAQSYDPNLVNKALDEVTSTNNKAANALPRIYIILQNPSLEGKVVQLTKQLKAADYLIRDIRVVSADFPANNQLRYCAGKGLISDRNEILKVSDRANIRLTPIVMSVEKVPSCANVISSRRYEVWITR